MQKTLFSLLILLALAGCRGEVVENGALSHEVTRNACHRFLPKGTLLPIPNIQSDNTLGVAVHTLILDESSAKFAAEAGFDTVVQVFPWKDLQPGRDQYDWAVADAMVDLAEQYQLKLVIRLDMPPDWAKLQASKGVPFDVYAYGEFVSTVGQRYSGRIEGYIIWNEPNLAAEWSRSGGDLNGHYESFSGWVAEPADYVGVVGIAYAALKMVDPAAYVIAGGLAPTNEQSERASDDRSFLARLYEADWSACFDILAVHDYGFGLPADIHWTANGGLNLARIERLRLIMEDYGDNRPVWITELGYTIHSQSQPPVSRQQQADYLVDAYQRVQSDWPWISLFTVWNLSIGRPIEDEMSGYSLVEPDGTPRPAYHAIADLIGERN